MGLGIPRNRFSARGDLGIYPSPSSYTEWKP